MTPWREDMEEIRRKRAERAREILRAASRRDLEGIQTGADFAAEKSQQSPVDARQILLNLLPDARRVETPHGPCLIRKIVIPVDETLCEIARINGTAPAGKNASGIAGGEQVLTPKAARRLGYKRPVGDLSDVWPDDLPAATNGEPASSSEDSSRAASRRKRSRAPSPWDVDFPGDWPEYMDERGRAASGNSRAKSLEEAGLGADGASSDDAAADEIEDVPRFRRILNRGRRNRERGSREGGGSFASSAAPSPADFPPISYECRPGAPLDTATVERFREIARADDFPPEAALERILFLDTETTGLAGGTGTFPFLTGLGYFQNLGTPAPVFVVEQYMMEDFCYEEAMLRLVEQRARQFLAICSYNGKTFDIPLLRTRFIFNRMRPSLWDAPHLDLLHISRRFWKGALGEVSLSMVEANILGVRRERDIEGALIPKIYFQFTRGFHPERLVPVFDHNVQDIASLGALLGRVCAYLQNPRHPALQNPAELTGLGMYLERLGRKACAADCLERALSASRGAEEQDRLLRHLGHLYKRACEWEKSIDIWRRLMERPLETALPAAVELAKYFEHQARDAEAARDVVRQAIALIERDAEARLLIGRAQPDLRKSPSQWIEEFEHRLRRLNRRTARHSSRREAGDSPEGAPAEDELFPDPPDGA